MAVTRINQHFPLPIELFLKARSLKEILYRVCDTEANLGHEMAIQEDIKVKY